LRTGEIGVYNTAVIEVIKEIPANNYHYIDCSMPLTSILEGDLARIHSVVGSRNRFQDATILVTGCAGFLGYYFMEYLLRYSGELGLRKLIGLDTFLMEKPRWLTALAAAYPAKLQVLNFDIANDQLEDIPTAKNARFVIHMASIASPTFYRRYPLETIDANVWGLKQLFNFYRGSDKLEGLLFFSSSEVYGDPDSANIPTAEDYRGNVACVGPRACYDESKRFGETMCYVFARKYGMPIIIARPFNNYGPGMRLGDKRLPADFAACIMNQQDIVILSNGSPTRTFCYISDSITGYFLCLLHSKFDSFNIGIEKPEISVRQFAEIYCGAGRELLNYSGQLKYESSSDSEYLTDNPNRRCPIIEKARTLLGYDPQILVEEGVRRYLQFLLQQGH
jgi:UDP-glucuronate decarboxylase